MARFVFYGVLLLLVCASVSGQSPETTPVPAPDIQPELLVVTMRWTNIQPEPDIDLPYLRQVGAGQGFVLVAQAIIDDLLWYQVDLSGDADSAEIGWIPAASANLVMTWRAVIETIDGVEMALVPPGCFPMGSAANAGEDDEYPRHIQCFDAPFWIDRYEVSNDDYGSVGYHRGETLPRDSVSWADAAAYCAARDARLPTEAEWEYAARGPKAPVYPWGDDFIDSNVVSSWQVTARRTEPVTGRSAGVSWVGAHNMSGNVWEWTSTLYAPYPYDADDGREDETDMFAPRVVRGGSCCSYIIADVRAAYRFPVAPFMQDSNIGFRCVRDTV